MSRLSVFVQLSKGETLNEIRHNDAAEYGGDNFSGSMKNLEQWGNFIKKEMGNSPQSPDQQVVVGHLSDGFENKKKWFKTIADSFDGKSKILLDKHFEFYNTNNILYGGQGIGCSFSDRSGHDYCPFVQPDGGIDAYFAHLLPALMINNLMKTLSSYTGNFVETRVLCQGTSGIRDEWWVENLSPANTDKKSSDIVDHLFISPAFVDVVSELSGWVPPPPPGKNVFRVCIWIIVPEHVFMLVWETHFLADGSRESSTCFAVDNVTLGSVSASNEFQLLAGIRDSVVEKFIDKINSYIDSYKCRIVDVMKELTSEFEKLNLGEVKGEESRGEPVKTQIISKSIKPLGFDDVFQCKDMVCVSFMTRCTLYLSMVNDCRFMFLVGHFSRAAGLSFERECYKDFQFLLKSFIDDANRCKRMVLFHPVEKPFVDISKICLVTIDPSDRNPLESRMYYQYQGSGYGFVCIGIGEYESPRFDTMAPTSAQEEDQAQEEEARKRAGSCAVMSQFTTTTPPLLQPVSFRTMFLFRTEESLTRIRECQSLLKGLRLRKVGLL